MFLIWASSNVAKSPIFDVVACNPQKGTVCRLQPGRRSLLSVTKDIIVRFNYRFPALVKTTRRIASQARKQIVSVQGTADILELSSEEAPVAAVFSVHERDGGRQFRYRGDRFYMQATRLGQPDTATSTGLEATMLSAICEHLVNDREHNATLYPRYLKNPLWAEWNRNLMQPRIPENFAHLPEYAWKMMSPFDPANHGDDDLAMWEQHATSYVSSLIVIDGKVWCPVEEPLLRWSYTSSYDDYVYDDLSAYHSRSGRPSEMPSPYGRATNHSHEGRTLPLYWYPHWRYMSLPEALASAHGEENWVCDINMPEAFVTDHAALRMDRAARLSVVEMKRAVYVGPGTVIRDSSDLGKHYRALRSLTQSGENADGDDLEPALESFLAFAESQGEDDYVGHSFQRSGIRLLVREALRSWRDRTISIDFDGRAHQATSKPRP
jgi:Holliday junction resolvase